MERMLVVVFDNELKTYDGSRALCDLDSEGSISVHGRVMLKKDEDGKVTVKQTGKEIPVRTLSRTANGAMVRLIG